ncbi:phosphate acetyltransferase [Candidatus Calescamantes bacterium]|nr:phosphate acetyltransferase [Candidatus Calescamantes bacterium]
MNRKIREKAKKLNKRVILPEAYDERTLQAAKFLLKEKIAFPVLVGDPLKLRVIAEGVGVDLEGIEIINPETYEKTEEFIIEYYEIRKEKGITLDQAKKEVLQDVFFGAMLLRHSIGDLEVAGAVNTTGNVIRAGLRIIGLREGINTVSSFFIMVTDKEMYGENGAIFFADCAVVPNPTSVQLADIAMMTASNAGKILNIDPKVALLSFSTKGSAKSPEAQKVVDACNILKERGVTFDFDGEIQVDAAIIPAIAERKAKDSPLKGRANVLIFPDLNAGNIGYKLVQRISGAMAIGPVIQGFAKPLCDLSRGCNWEDIVDTVAVSSLL